MMTRLEHLYTVDRTSLSLFADGEIHPVGDGHVLVYSDKQNQLILRFVDYFGQENESIVLTPQSSAWLQDNQMLVVDRPQGGRWRLDCSASDPEIFSALQDFLTYFIKYENRHQLRNTLAMMDPITCKVNEVIARNVVLEREKGDDPKKPVFMETADFRPGHRKVRILYHTGNALVTGSDWVAYTMIMAGRALARHIEVQTRNYSNTIEPSEKIIRLTQTDRSYIEAFFNVNRSLIRGAGDILSKATTAATSSINMLYSDTHLQDNDPVQNAKRHLGVSAFHAAQNVLAGLTLATGNVLASSRDSVVDMIYKKYGEDAGFLAEQAMGASKSDVADVLVYYDDNGVSRQVFVGTDNTSQHVNTTLTDQQLVSSIKNPINKENSNDPKRTESGSVQSYEEKEEEGNYRSIIFNYVEDEDNILAATSPTHYHPLEASAHSVALSQSSSQSGSTERILV